MATRISWTGPTQREDGTPLSQEEQANLVYNLGWQPLGQADQEYTVIASLPATLNPDGRYQVLIADLALPPEQDVDIAMAATDRQGRSSRWSGEAQIVYTAPNPPEALAVD